MTIAVYSLFVLVSEVNGEVSDDLILLIFLSIASQPGEGSLIVLSNRYHM